MQHFLEISQIPVGDIEALLQKAKAFKAKAHLPSYPGQAIANLFYENSTRTRVSFELAAKRLGLSVINFDVDRSSEQKGEVLEDTLLTLKAMGINLFVMRHSQDGIVHNMAAKLGESAHFINAGDGRHAHPSQALLDLMTIVERKPNLNQLKIAVIGDIRHSRVANSFQCACAHMNVGELVMVAPEIWQPETIHYGYVTDNLHEGIKQADVVMCLRVQRERLDENEQLDFAEYREKFALTENHLQWAKHDAIVMHPGPMNRGVEIDSVVVDGPQSVILEQVNNGVWVRMAMIDAICSTYL